MLYLPQDAANLYAIGDKIDVIVSPYPTPIECTAVRLGDVLTSAPPHLQRYYGNDENLLPVYLRPQKEQMQWIALRIGGLVKLPFGAVTRSTDETDKTTGTTP